MCSAQALLHCNVPSCCRMCSEQTLLYCNVPSCCRMCSAHALLHRNFPSWCRMCSTQALLHRNFPSCCRMCSTQALLHRNFPSCCRMCSTQALLHLMSACHDLYRGGFILDERYTRTMTSLLIADMLKASIRWWRGPADLWPNRGYHPFREDLYWMGGEYHRLPLLLKLPDQVMKVLGRVAENFPQQICIDDMRFGFMHLDAAPPTSH